MDNDDLSTNSEYDNCPNTNFPLDHALNQVDWNTNLVNEVFLTEVVLQPIEKPRSGPHKKISKKSDNKRKSRLENKKHRSE